MKKVVWTLGMLALTSSMALAQDKAAIEKALIANEAKASEAFAKGDKAAFNALVAPDGVALDGTGAMKVADLVAMFDKVKITSQSISDAKVVWVNDTTAVVHYKWTGAGTFDGQKVHSPTYASTVWTKKGDKWWAIFHQETDVMKPPPPKPTPKK